jgi:hypothetical protein
MFVETLRNWQGLELHALEMTSKVIQSTDNAVIREVMEIIRNDSLQHHRVQQFLIDTFTKQAISLTPEELGHIWTAIEEHDRVEKKTIALAKELREQVTFPVQRMLLDYLLADEEKHDKLLEHLEQVKKGMYPYGS